MALKIAYTDNQGNNYANAYIVVDRLKWAENEPVRAGASLYKNKAAKDAGAQRVTRFSVSFDLTTGSGIIAQCYEALKLLPELSGYTEVA